LRRWPPTHPISDPRRDPAICDRLDRTAGLGPARPHCRFRTGSTAQPVSDWLRYRRSIRVLTTTDGELAELVCSPFAAELLSDPDGLVVVTTPDGSGSTDGAVDRLASLPCIVVADDRSTGARPLLADLTTEDGVASVDDIVRVAERNPVAATALVLCLRETPSSLGRGLVAESATYSVLQAGAEFKRWRASRPSRPDRASERPPVRLIRQGDVLEVVLNRPHVRNALSRSMRDGLLEGLALAASDDSIAEVVLRGEGPSFCSGGDLDEFGSFSDPASAHSVRLATSIGRSIDALGPRVVARVHGPCAGSGVELPAFARRVVARRDFSASLPEVGLGLIPGAGGTVSITRRVGRHRMALLALSGARIDAATALQWGLIDAFDDGADQTT
jgi:enoyl-CoA hydratase/carnithine racemase